MTSAAHAYGLLLDSLGTVYPTRLADRANRAGRVTVVVEPVRSEYTDLMCDPSPLALTGAVTVLAAMTGEQAVADLLTHTDQVADLVRAAGWTPTEWVPDAIEDTPAITFTVTANAQG